MGSTANPQPTVSFSDLQAIANQIQNDNTAQNNAVSAQLGEVSQLLTDYATAINNGTPVAASDLQQVVAQLRSVDSLIQSNTANIQASSSQITQADPNAAQKAPNPTPAGGDTSGAQATTTA